MLYQRHNYLKEGNLSVYANIVILNAKSEQRSAVCMYRLAFTMTDFDYLLSIFGGPASCVEKSNGTPPGTSIYDLSIIYIFYARVPRMNDAHWTGRYQKDIKKDRPGQVQKV